MHWMQGFLVRSSREPTSVSSFALLFVGEKREAREKNEKKAG